MRESDIERYLVARVKALLGEVRKLKWVGRNGAPDRVVMLPEQVLWVELKAPGERCRPHQLREHQRMRRMGQSVVVIDSLDGVDDLLRACSETETETETCL